MKKKNFLVSVIMNCHNGQKYLKKSIKSILDQEYKNWELIFWDNKSTDNSKKILKSFKDKRIKYFFSKNYFKLYDARNRAVQKAKGKFICFLDTDDWWYKNKLKLQVKEFQKNKNYNVIYTNLNIFYEKNKKIKIFSKEKLPSGTITQEMLDKYRIGVITVMIKREIFKKYKFDKNYEIIGDFDFFMKISLSNKFGYIDKPLAFYRIHGKNFSDIKLNIYHKELQHWINKIGPNFIKEGFLLRGQILFLRKLKFKNFLSKIKNLFFGRVVQW